MSGCGTFGCNLIASHRGEHRDRKGRIVRPVASSARVVTSGPVKGGRCRSTHLGVRCAREKGHKGQHAGRRGLSSWGSS